MSAKSFRSDNVYLNLLPCPRSCLPYYSFIGDCCDFLMSMLLLSGDIETNPGPDTKVIMNQLKMITNYLQEIKREKVKLNNRRLNNLSLLSQKLTTCEAWLGDFEKCMNEVTAKLDDLENRSRRGNFIVYGIKDRDGETSESLGSAVVKDVVEGVLNLKFSVVERIHRLGRKNANSARPVIFKLIDFRDKTRILKNCHKLRGSSISVREDSSQRVQQIRKTLWESSTDNRQNGDKAC